MAKFQKKEDVLRHLGMKVLVFGTDTTGKSKFAGTFPNINLVDSEDGQSFYIKNNPNIKGVLKMTSASELQETLDELNDEEELNKFDTIVVDSGTKIYENMSAAAYSIVEERAKKQIQKGKNIDLDDLNLSRRDYGHIKRWNQQLNTSYILLSSLGKCVVVTAHEKEVYDDPNSENKKIIGYVPDLGKKAKHDPDIILYFMKEEKKTNEIRYYTKVLKDRTEVTKPGDIIENPSFEIWREYWESTKSLGVKDAFDMRNDVNKDIKTMAIEDNKLQKTIKDFSKLIKILDKSNQVKVMKYANDLKISNPLETDDIEGLEKLIEFIKTFKLNY